MFGKAIVCLGICLALAGMARAETIDLGQLRFISRSDSKAILGLIFLSSDIPVRVENEGSVDQRAIATVRGTFARVDWALLAPNGSVIVPPMPRTNGQIFELPVVLSGLTTRVELRAKGPEGKIESEWIEINYDSFLSPSVGANEIATLGERWNLGLGTSAIEYTQSFLNSLNEFALTPKVSYQRPIAQNWDASASTYLAVPLTESQSNMKAYFLGVNARAAYTFPQISSPWMVSVGAGLYYATMITSGISFGYRNMIGPQVFPTVRRNLTARDNLGAYFKYSPVTSGTSNLGFSSHELATGLTFTHVLSRQHPLSAAFDYSDISVSSGTINIDNKSFTLSGSYGL